MFIPFVFLFTSMLMIPPNRSLYVVVLRAARGYDARLPCGQGKVFLDGPRSYVVWLKDDKEFLYRFPEDENAPRSLDPNIIYGTTCNAGVCYDETSLLLKNVSDKDGGLYTCRVHYQASPSDEFVIDIRLVEPAGIPQIHTENGESPENMAPISLGANLTLTCFLVDGPKDVNLYWERNGEPVQSNTIHGDNSITIHITNVTWNENLAKYECLAQNADVSQPFTTSFNMKMNSLPMEAELSHNEPYLEAGVPVNIQCRVLLYQEVDATTNVIWSMNGARFGIQHYVTEVKSSYVTSTLLLTPKLDDDNNELMCKVRRPKLNAMTEVATVLHVGTRPTCASIQSIPDDDELQNNNSLVIKCIVFSVKRPLEFTWNFSDSKITHNNIGATSNLVIKQEGEGMYYTTLMWKNNMPKGHLTCLATNKFGAQIEPCAYSILPTHPPNTPLCEIERFDSVILVDCSEGFNDGYNKTVYLELKNHRGGSLRNISSSSGTFKIEGLSLRMSYSVVIYASNLRGRSAQLIRLITAVPIITTTRPETEEEKANKAWLITGWYKCLGVFVAFLVTVVFALAGTCLYAYICMTKEERAKVHSIETLRTPTDGNFRREPDIVGEALSATNITVNQMTAIDNATSPMIRGSIDTEHLVHYGNTSLIDMVQTPQCNGNTAKDAVQSNGSQGAKVRKPLNRGGTDTTVVQPANGSRQVKVATAPARGNVCIVSRAGANYYV